ncbi:MAG: radical SAM protein [Deltaproteobacteria bacterium]|nr:radical SAM protein [Deltaproteobacteria bacterium]
MRRIHTHRRSSPASPIVDEQGTIHREAGTVVALGYPAPYRAGSVSLGAQTVYGAFNQVPGLSCTRFFLPGQGAVQRPLVSFETGRPVDEARAIAFSIACEAELIGIVELLVAADLEPLAEARGEVDPPVIIGGPLTLLDPHLVAPLADIVVVGEAEEALVPLGEALVATSGRGDLADALHDPPPGVWIPNRAAKPPSPAVAPAHLLPASAVTWSPHAEFKNLFLVEAARGCKRGCSFCVLSARACGRRPFTPVSVERILQTIPKGAPGVGLVGAAVTDHPEIVRIVDAVVKSGRRVSLSSIRADRLTDELARMLGKGGLRTLTVAADGSSERLRKAVHKGISAEHLLRAADIAKRAGIRGIKVYSMIGLPGEEDEDVLEFADLAIDLGGRLRTSVALQAFVPKPGTPLAQVKMTEEAIIRRRLDLVKRHVGGKVRIMPTSPRWSWLDWKLAHAGENAAPVAIAAYRKGGNFAAWRRAIKEAGF